MREPSSDRFDWRREVAVTGDDYGRVEVVVVGVFEHAYRYVHVGLLLFALGPSVTAVAARDPLGQEVAEVDFYRSPGPESIDIQSLAAGLCRISFDPGREIPGQGELLAGFQQGPAELGKVSHREEPRPASRRPWYRL